MRRSDWLKLVIIIMLLAALGTAVIVTNLSREAELQTAVQTNSAEVHATNMALATQIALTPR